MRYIVAPTSDYLAHSAKGSEWKKHKYIKKADGKYYYPNSYEGGRHLDSTKNTTGTIPTEKDKKMTEDQKKSDELELRELQAMDEKDNKLFEELSEETGMKEESFKNLMQIAQTKGYDSEEYKSLCVDLSEGDQEMYDSITKKLKAADTSVATKRREELSKQKSIKHGIEFPAYVVKPSKKIIYW